MLREPPPSNEIPLAIAPGPGDAPICSAGAEAFVAFNGVGPPKTMLLCDSLFTYTGPLRDINAEPGPGLTARIDDFPYIAGTLLHEAFHLQEKHCKFMPLKVH